jgi:hypothetical protein
VNAKGMRPQKSGSHELNLMCSHFTAQCYTFRVDQAAVRAPSPTMTPTQAATPSRTASQTPTPPPTAIIQGGVLIMAQVGYCTQRLLLVALLGLDASALRVRRRFARATVFLSATRRSLL